MRVFSTLARHAIFLATFLAAILAPQTAGPQSVLRFITGIDGSQAVIRRENAPPVLEAGATRLCAINPATETAKHGFSFGAALPVALEPGYSRCWLVAPLRQNIVLWAYPLPDKATRSISVTLDLTGRAGQTIFIQWVQGGKGDPPYN